MQTNLSGRFGFAGRDREQKAVRPSPMSAGEPRSSTQPARAASGGNQRSDYRSGGVLPVAEESRVHRIGPAPVRAIADQRHSNASDLAQTMVANFRSHPHICNVLTHISGGSWTKIEKALAEILDRERTEARLSKLAENIVELFWAERGVSGRIIKPFVARLLAVYVPATTASEVSAHVEFLFRTLSEPVALPEPEQQAPPCRRQELIGAHPVLTGQVV